MAVYAWSLTAANNSTADASINWQEGQAPSSVNNSARAMMAALKAGFNDIAGVSALGGSGNTFTLSLSQALPSLTNAVVGFIATRGNTGAVTLNVDATGAKPLRAISGTDLTTGQIVSGSFYICTYYPSAQEWLISGNGTVTNAQLATMPTLTVKANVTGGTATPSDVPVATFGAALGYLSAPAGTRMVFNNTAAPTGWTKSTTHDNKALRVVSGTVSSGGSVNFTTAFASQAVTGTNAGTALTTAQLPAHTHDTTLSYTTFGGADSSRQYYGRTGTLNMVGSDVKTSASTGSGDTHTHTFTGTAIDLAVAYVDLIIAQKD